MYHLKRESIETTVLLKEKVLLQNRSFITVPIDDALESES